MSVLHGRIEEMTFIILVFLWILLESYNAISSSVRRGRKTKVTGGKGSTAILRITLYSSIIGAFFLSSLGTLMLPRWFFYLGASLMVTGMILRQWAIHTLGGYFGIKIGVEDGQKVVDRGVYHYIRHPSYLGIYIVGAGIGLCLRSVPGIFIILFLVGIALAYRIRVEERFLVSQLGDEYSLYMKRTKRLIPFLI